MFAIASFLGFAMAAGAAQADCHERPDVVVWTAPESPTAGEPLRILVVSEAQKSGEVAVVGPGKKAIAVNTIRRGGPPFSFYAEVPAPAAGAHQIELREGGRSLGC